MTPSELIDQLKRRLPADLAADLVNNFIQIRSDVTTETLERSAPGKFVETVVQVLQFLDTGQYDEKPKVDEYLKNLESRSINLSDDLRITLARIARASYTLRNKRSIAHKGGVDPNIYDLRYLYIAAQWILSEITRQILLSDMATAGKLVEFIQIPISPIVEDFGDKRLVLKVGTTEEELLTLLLHYYPVPILTSQLRKDIDRRAPSTVSHTITAMYNKRLIEGNKQQGYKLTILGHQQATELVKSEILACSDV
ncbi:hypothetical protein ES703_15671 [subsurface metagenome]